MTATFCPNLQCPKEPPIWHAKYSVPAAVTTASYRLGGLSLLPPPRLVEPSSIALAKSQLSYAASDAIR